MRSLAEFDVTFFHGYSTLAESLRLLAFASGICIHLPLPFDPG
jgi:hypothetical protein